MGKPRRTPRRRKRRRTKRRGRDRGRAKRDRAATVAAAPDARESATSSKPRQFPPPLPEAQLRLSRDFDWPRFDPAACQECAITIPMHVTAWIMDDLIVCRECFAVLDEHRQRRGDVVLHPRRPAGEAGNDGACAVEESRTTPEAPAVARGRPVEPEPPTTGVHVHHAPPTPRLCEDAHQRSAPLAVPSSGAKQVHHGPRCDRYAAPLIRRWRDAARRGRTDIDAAALTQPPSQETADVAVTWPVPAPPRACDCASDIAAPPPAVDTVEPAPAVDADAMESPAGTGACKAAEMAAPAETVNESPPIGDAPTAAPAAHEPRDEQAASKADSVPVTFLDPAGQGREHDPQRHDPAASPPPSAADLVEQLLTDLAAQPVMGKVADLMDELAAGSPDVTDKQRLMHQARDLSDHWLALAEPAGAKGRVA